MSKIHHFKVFVLYSGDVATDIDHLYVKRIYLVGFLYSYRGLTNNNVVNIIYESQFIKKSFPFPIF
jgi:hypothetical protein